MTRKEAARQNHFVQAMGMHGVSVDDADKLRRISMTLHRWHERACNGEVEREDDGRVFGVHHGYRDTSRWPIADRETGALKRLAAIMSKYPALQSYVQGDPRGVALYILRPSDVPPNGDIDAYYSRGIAVY